MKVRRPRRPHNRIEPVLVWVGHRCVMALAEVVAQPRLGLVVVAPLAEFEAGVFPRIKFKCLI